MKNITEKRQMLLMMNLEEILNNSDCNEKERREVIKEIIRLYYRE